MTRRKEEVPTFHPSAGLTLSLPDRAEMLSALEQGIEGLLFKVRYLSHDEDTCVDEDAGGLASHAGDVAYALKAAMRLATMYEALQQGGDDECDEEENEAEQPEAAR